MISWYTRYGPEGASSRYRVYQYLDGLEAAGFQARAESLAEWQSSRWSASRGVGRRVRSLAAVGRTGDVIVIQKEPIMPPQMWPVVSRRLRTLSPLVWDVDDAVWTGSPAAHRMACDMATMVDVVAAGNGLIADWFRRHGARDVRVIPTCFDPRSHERTAADGDVVELAWVGSPSTADRFQSELVRFRQLLESANVQLTCVGSPPFVVPAARPIRFVEWSPSAEQRVLERAHYGLSFLPRDEYSDHKCGFKLIQYLAYGVVPIATRSPVHEAVLGGLGHLVDSDSDVRELEQILKVRPTDRECEAARSQWKANFSVSVGTQAWVDLLSVLTSD